MEKAFANLIKNKFNHVVTRGQLNETKQRVARGGLCLWLAKQQQRSKTSDRDQRQGAEHQ